MFFVAFAFAIPVVLRVGQLCPLVSQHHPDRLRELCRFGAAAGVSVLCGILVMGRFGFSQIGAGLVLSKNEL